MNVEKIQDFTLGEIVLICALPDMGKVGGLVTEHLTKKLETKTASKIVLTEKPWVEHKAGIINLPNDKYTLSVDEKNSIIIFTGNNQPQEPRTVFEIVDYVLSTVQKMGKIKLAISTGGYLPLESKKGDNVFGIATNEKLLQMLNSYGIKPLSSEVKSITWFNGLILGRAKNQNIDGVGLFGEITDTEASQYKAASNVIHAIEKMLKIKIDTKELDERVVEVPTEVKKEGPGIG